LYATAIVNTGREARINAASRHHVDAEGIQRWVVVYLAVLTGRDSDHIDIDTPFSRFDIDSVDAVEMAAEFEKAFGYGIGPEFFLQSVPSVREMVEHLSAAARAGTPG
jgi:acyl carrier protein